MNPTDTQAELVAVLQRNGIDTSTFQPIYQTADEILSAFCVHGDEAGGLWFHLRDLSAQTKHWPVILGVANDLAFLRDAIPAYPASRIPAIIAQGLNMQADVIIGRDPEAAVDEEYIASKDYQNFRLKQDVWKQVRRDGIQTTAGSPNSIDSTWFRIPQDHRNRHYPEVYVALVPAIHPWEIPAYLRFGNWNACPSPAEHVCMMKHWHDLYGSTVVGISHDVVEMLAQRRPARHADALALAFEQFMYCEDIVLQGVGTMEKLAAILLNLDIWYFWWD